MVSRTSFLNTFLSWHSQICPWDFLLLPVVKLFSSLSSLLSLSVLLFLTFYVDIPRAYELVSIFHLSTLSSIHGFEHHLNNEHSKIYISNPDPLLDSRFIYPTTHLPSPFDYLTDIPKFTLQREPILFSPEMISSSLSPIHVQGGSIPSHNAQGGHLPWTVAQARYLGIVFFCIMPHIQPN